MIKKISNWIFGSFFRTMGRFFFFLFFGFLLAIILSKSDIKWTDLLGIDTIKADTYVKGVDSPWKNNSGTALPKNGPFHYIDKLSGTGGSNTAFDVSEFYLTSNDQVDITSIKGGTVEIPFYISATVVSSTGGGSQLVCATWQPQGQGYYCSQFQMRDFTDSTTLIKPNVNVWTMLVYDNGYTDMCTIDMANNKIRCPIANLLNNNKIWFIQVRTQVYYYDNYPQQWYTIGLGDKVNLFKNDFVSLEEQQQNQTQTIIESQENQTQQQIQSQMVCEKIDKNKVKNKNVYLDGTNGNEGNTTYSYGVTDYIRINNTDKIRIIETVTSSTPRVCFYNINKTYLSCIKTNEITDFVTIPYNASYMKMTINYETDRPQFEICQNGNQAINNIISDTNTIEADQQANSFFSNFTSQDNGGISSIITAPLQAISGLVSATCTPITLPLPYLDNKTIVLPCMSAIYQEHFGAFFTIYQTIIFGALAYRMLVSIFMMIQGFKNPDDDKIEVVDL